MFSVVTISRDRPDAFLNHLLSLRNQVTSDQDYWELIILDDSTEGDNRQEQAIKTVCSKGMPCNVKAFRALNRKQYGGEGKTINFGIKQTTGDPIFVLCGDDVYPSYHLYMMYTIWNKFMDGGLFKRILGWPLYHLKPFHKLDSKTLIDNSIDAIPEVSQGFLARRETRFPEAPPGLDVVDSMIDDRACFSREFLFTIKGWPEWEGCWWRDSWFTAIAALHGYKFICDWASWSLHQWHVHRPSLGNAEAKAYYDKYAGKALVSNEGKWGNQEVREIELGE